MTASPIDLRRHLRLKDPRINRRKRHLLLDIITIAICAVIADADTWKDIALFGRKRHEWLQRFLELPNGIPSQHTFERVFDRLDPQALQKCLLGWLHDLSQLLGVGHIAIDGKTLRHSGGGKSPHRHLHLVSAWATQANLTLGQVAVDEKSNAGRKRGQRTFCLPLGDSLTLIFLMPRNPRASQGGYCYHVLNRGNGRRTIFHKDSDCAAFVKLLRQAGKRIPMRLLT